MKTSNGDYVAIHAVDWRVAKVVKATHRGLVQAVKFSDHSCIYRIDRRMNVFTLGPHQAQAARLYGADAWPNKNAFKAAILAA
jgi:hypothetical protein